MSPASHAQLSNFGAARCGVGEKSLKELLSGDIVGLFAMAGPGTILGVVGFGAGLINCTEADGLTLRRDLTGDAPGDEVAMLSMTEDARVITVSRR